MSGMKKAIGGSIHRIREFELEKVMSFLTAIGFSFAYACTFNLTFKW